MSFFNAFGQNGLAALAQSLENIGNIVAPIAPEDEENEHERVNQRRNEEEDDEQDSFDNRVQNFFNNFREGGSNNNDRDATIPLVEPGSPESLVSIELGEDSPRSIETKGSSGRKKKTFVAASPSSFGMVDGIELEKKVQAKYREQLEHELENTNRKYTELQRSSAKQIAYLESECKEWKQLAESSKQPGFAEEDREEEINTLYEKLGTLTAELETKEDELTAANEIIHNLKSNQSNHTTDPAVSLQEAQRLIDELESAVEASRSQCSTLEEQLEEAQDACSQLRAQEDNRENERQAMEEQLTELTNQLRASNKTISALEEKLIDAQQQPTSPTHAPIQTDSEEPLYAELHARLTENQERITELQQMLSVSEDRRQQYEEEVGRAQSREEELTERIDQLTREMEEVQAKHLQAYEKEQRAAIVLCELQEGHDALQARCVELERLVATHQENEAGLTEAVEKWKDAHTSALKEMEEKQVESVSQLQQRDEKIQQLTLDIESLQRTSDETAQKLVSAETGLAEASVKIASLSTELQQLQQTQASACHISPSAVSEAVEIASPPHSASSSNPTANTISEEGTVTATPAGIVSVSANNALAAAQADYQKAIKKIKIVNKQLKERDAEIVRLKESISSTFTSSAAAMESESLQGEGDVQMEVSSLRSQLATLQQTLEQTSAESHSLTEEKQVLQDRVDEREQCVAELREKLTHLQSACDDHVVALKESENTLEKMRSEHSLELSELQVALECEKKESASMKEALAASADEVAVLQRTVKEEKALLMEVTTVRERVQEQLTQLLNEAHQLVCSDSTDFALSTTSDTLDNSTIVSTDPTHSASIDHPLTTAHSDYADAIRKIKTATKQLKDRDAEILRLKTGIDKLQDELVTAQTGLQQRDQDHTIQTMDSEMIATTKLELQSTQLDLQRTQADHATAIEELQNTTSQLEISNIKLADAEQQAQEHAVALDSLRSELASIREKLSEAVAKVESLEGSLTASEEALKATEEVAWHAKAEASELLFAFEQEQAGSQAAKQASDSLQDRLAECQAELKQLQTDQTAGSRIADLSAVRDQMMTVHRALSAASERLRFLDRPAQSASPIREASSTFEHLVGNISTDLLSPLSMLAVSSKSLSALAEQVMAHLFEVTDRADSLQASEGSVRETLQQAHHTLLSLLAAMDVDTGTVDGSQDTKTTVGVANRLLQYVNLVAENFQSVVRKDSVDSSELDRLTTALSDAHTQWEAAQVDWTAERAALTEQLQQCSQQASAAQADWTAERAALAEQLQQCSQQASAAQADWTAERAALTEQLQQCSQQASAQTAQKLATLQAELQQSEARFEALSQRAQSEKQQMLAALSSAQAGSSQAAEQVQPLRAQIQKLETENKGLHQVIAQLRQVRKNTKGENDNAITERDELRSLNTALQHEVTTLEERLRVFTATDATVSQLRAELHQANMSMVTAERSLETTRRALAQKEKECYDKESELDVTRSDMLLARQELDRRLVEVTNLQEAISQVEAERNFAVSRFQKEVTEKIDDCKRQSEIERAKLQEQLQKQLEEERERRIKLESSSEDYELFYRKAEMEFKREKKKMQATVENALTQLNNNQTQVIDRMLVANLIVSYFKRRRSVDVLKIIAKVLAFDDEQLVAVGLKVPPIDLVGSLLSAVIGRPAPPPEVEGDNLAEQWINFLINESGQDASNSPGLVPRARSHSGGSSTSSTGTTTAVVRAGTTSSSPRNTSIPIAGMKSSGFDSDNTKLS